MLMSPEWTECRRVVHSACAFVGASQSATCEAEALQRHLLAQQIAQQRNGVSPVSGWLCPSTHSTNLLCTRDSSGCSQPILTEEILLRQVKTVHANTHASA